jgi:hypothetical protein
MFGLRLMSWLLRIKKFMITFRIFSKVILLLGILFSFSCSSTPKISQDNDRAWTTKALLKIEI